MIVIGSIGLFRTIDALGVWHVYGFSIAQRNNIECSGAGAVRLLRQLHIGVTIETVTNATSSGAIGSSGCAATVLAFDGPLR